MIIGGGVCGMDGDVGVLANDDTLKLVDSAL